MNINITLLSEQEFEINKDRYISDINGLKKVLSPDGIEVDEAKYLHILKEAKLYVAILDSHIVGMVTVNTIRKLSGDVGYIDDVVTGEAVRGQGVGNKLMEKVIVDAKNNGLKSIELTCRKERAQAMNLYLKYGFLTRDTNTMRLQLQ